MEKLSDLLKVSSEVTMDISPGAELIQNFRKEFPVTAKLVLEMDSGSSMEEKEKHGITEEAFNQARALHEEVREFYPVLANIFAEIHNKVNSGKIDIKTDFVFSAVLRELQGFLMACSFTMDWLHKHKQMTNLESSDELSKLIIEMLPEKERGAIAVQSWIAVAYRNSGAAGALPQLMLSEKFPPKQGGGPQIIVRD